MPPKSPFLYDCIRQYERVKSLGDRAVNQVDDAQFFQNLGEDANSIAIVIKHLAGNLRSRWTDLLTNDGEKANRNRDEEFAIRDTDTRDRLIQDWEAGWTLALETLNRLTDDRLDSTVLIRGEAHTVREAILRGLHHYAYHVGQIVYLAKLQRGADWRSLSIHLGGSTAYNQNPTLDQPDVGAAELDRSANDQ